MPLIETNPIKAALEHIRAADYPRAYKTLVDAYNQDPHREELARIANLISPCGMISHAIDALHRLDGNIEAYLADKPVDQQIGSAAPFPQYAKADCPLCDGSGLVGVGQNCICLRPVPFPVEALAHA